ncbi:MAG: motility protein A [Candidatus Marinimicrobia bacterium]|jgi:chemotaxis protein MotA|nr:motility protein A [Candidatus Neomarinimicrobiota bacterium]MBT3617334.1 motility protein A [Candidatus Neomarinimicrobiota bacterium]MBT3829274.1 motility protein A [Candidatus Neomarinimicrobiota bacterium]MBT3998232.1 motility protein A [Candidatus Neomarinimicrobiota bacterium]MBT4281533.1 motility protein A [Candidatus Neomarinimicrobiota bacterium]
MDIATIVGIIIGLGSIFGGIFMAASAANASMAGFISPSSFAIVFGGMVASVSVAFPLSDVMKLGAAMGAVFKGGKLKLGDVVDDAVEAADVGRKGAADLEKAVEGIRNPFFRDGVQMVVDGYSLDELTEILETRIEYREVREKTQVGLFKSMGNMAPAWGMIGTLIGLVIMLSGFGGEGGADALGPGMSAALITTFYGAVFANLFFLPMSEKLDTRTSFTSTLQAMLVEASRLIHQKKHPLIVREKLNSFIPPKEWKSPE